METRPPSPALLLVGLLGSALATLVVVRFEDRLSAQLAVAFFIPAIVYLADAVGTQTEAVVVRGLSFHAPRFRRLLAGELSAGGMIGVALGVMRLPLLSRFWRRTHHAAGDERGDGEDQEQIPPHVY